MALSAAAIAHSVKILAVFETAAPTLKNFPDLGGFTASGGFLAEATPESALPSGVGAQFCWSRRV